MLLPLAHEKTELIEVVRITEPGKQWDAEDLLGEDVGIWEAADVHEVLALIAELPSGESYRCFVPGWGIRAHSSAGLLFQIAFCFRCHNARLWGPAVPTGQAGIYSFDADSLGSVDLLQRFRSCTPVVRRAWATAADRVRRSRD
ncbi:hypothetical protein [Streptacidiphilus sp. EB103A]|uniref:hypothetical protein n=1 Tax=Streptacidiphilus sp. EB103A TaxID=3156275 RepID=UPI003519B1F8